MKCASAIGAAAFLGMLLPAIAAARGEINLYSYRQGFLIEPIVAEFTKQTGIEVNVAFAKTGMVDKIKAAGANNPADAVLTVDVGRLDALEQAGLLEPISSAALEANIPAHLRHPDGLWFGLTTRARVVYAHKDRVAAGEIRSVADLADPKLEGLICSRSGKHAYNVALIATVIAHEGEAQAEQWLRGVKANLARKPQGNDRAQAKAIYEGVCDLAIANHYYLGKMATNEDKPEQKAWAEVIEVIFLDQGGRGQHVNISGAAVIKGAKNRANAVRLIEFLSSDGAQALYATHNFEYPVKPGVRTDPFVESLGGFAADKLPLTEIARHLRAASQLVDKVGFDEGP